VADDILPEQEKNNEKAGPGLPEKKNLVIAGMVIVLVIIAIIAVVVVLQVPSVKGTVQPLVIKNSTMDEKAVTGTQIQNVQTTLRKAGTQTPGQTPSLKATTLPPVDFVLQSGDPGNCGLTCRQLDASITNTGTETAHNVCITVGLHNSRNEIIYLNGESSLNRCIGDISGGQKKTEPITINADCGAFATKCIGETLTLQTRVTSVEKTVQFPDQMIAV